jgi:hypothetical protein
MMFEPCIDPLLPPFEACLPEAGGEADPEVLADLGAVTASPVGLDRRGGQTRFEDKRGS